MDKGAELNKRVWTLFQKAGFATKPNSADPSEHVVVLPEGKERPVDLYAQDETLGVTIIGQNKARKKLAFSAEIHDLEKLKKATNANGAVFIVPEKEVEKSDKDFGRKNGVMVWDEKQLAYYEAVADALGAYAKYEIIHSFEITTNEEKLKDTVLAIRLGQPRPNGTQLYMFTVPAEKLLKVCVVLRKAEGSAYAYQRILSKKRLPNVGAFVETPKALLPTSIVVHRGESVTVDEIKSELLDERGNKVETARGDHQLVTLTFPLKYGLMELIDGQHRLFGFVHAQATTRAAFNLVVLGLRQLDEKRRSDTFVAINDNARRVDANLVAFLRYTNDEKTCKQNPDLMAIKIVVELNKASPFKDAIRLLDVGTQRLTLKGLSGYDLKGLVSANGLLRMYYKENTSKRYLRVLRTYFGLIRAEFPDEWDDPDTYITATNRGISAFFKLLRSMLKTEKKRLTQRVIKKYIKALRLEWSGTWETEKLQASYVGSQGWKRFHRDMIKAIQKRYKTFQE